MPLFSQTVYHQWYKTYPLGTIPPYPHPQHHRCSRWNNYLSVRSRVLPEKLTTSQIDKKFSAFNATRSLIAASTSTRHLSPTSTTPIQSLPLHPTPCRFILIYFFLPFIPRSSKRFPSLRSSDQNIVCTSPFSHTCNMPCPSHFS